MQQDVTSIRVSKTFKSWLVRHGNYGDTHEQILIKLLGKKFTESMTGDNKKKIDYSKDIDSTKYKEKRRKSNEK